MVHKDAKDIIYIYMCIHTAVLPCRDNIGWMRRLRFGRACKLCRSLEPRTPAESALGEHSCTVVFEVCDSFRTTLWNPSVRSVVGKKATWNRLAGLMWPRWKGVTFGPTTRHWSPAGGWEGHSKRLASVYIYVYRHVFCCLLSVIYFSIYIYTHTYIHL